MSPTGAQPVEQITFEFGESGLGLATPDLLLEAAGDLLSAGPLAGTLVPLVLGAGPLAGTLVPLVLVAALCTNAELAKRARIIECIKL